MKVLSENDLKKIHSASLKILKEIGVKFPNREVLNIFKENGAEVDFKNEIAKIPKALIETKIKEAVRNQNYYYRKYRNHDRDSQKITGWMIISKTNDVIEYGTYNKRRSTLSDILKAITIGNNLETTERISCFVKPAKYDGEYIDIINYYLLYIYSKKRYFLSPINSLNSAKCIIEMARVVADNEIQLRDGTLVEYELLPIANLRFSENHLKIAVEFAKNKIKILAGHWCWMGYHTPMTYASAITLSNANILAGITLVMLLNPEQLFFDYICDIFTVNKNDTGLPLMGSPNQAIFPMAARQLADFYGFKICLANSGLTDAIEDNFQSGFERGVTAILAITSGADLIGLQGLLGADQGVNFEQLIIDNELFRYLNFILNRKIEINDENLDFEIIKMAGIGTDFLNSLKDSKRMKDYYWDSDIFVANRYDNWTKNKTSENIKCKLNKILEENSPLKIVISEDKANKLDEIIRFYIKDKSFIDSFKKDLKDVARTWK